MKPDRDEAVAVFEDAKRRVLRDYIAPGSLWLRVDAPDPFIRRRGLGTGAAPVVLDGIAGTVDDRAVEEWRRRITAWVRCREVDAEAPPSACVTFGVEDG